MKRISIFIILLVISASCSTNPTDSLGEYAPTLYLEGYLIAGQPVDSLYVGTTTPLLGTFSREDAGLPDATVKTEAGALKEWQWNTPTGIYGCNKLYCELVGTYLSRREQADSVAALDFRSIRFPGLISAETLPSGGTTDFAPEMIHAAARNEPYTCFVTEDSRLPFMTMPDAIEALVGLALADAADLGRRVYNIRGFSCSAAEILEEVRRHFPEASVAFQSVPQKQRAVDSWPADVDDSRARRDWGLDPEHGLTEAFGEYLVPALRERYGREGSGTPLPFQRKEKGG